MRRRIVLVSVFAAVLFLGFATPGGAIVNGTPDGTAHPAVGVMFDNQGDACSGVLVRSDVYGTVFLTAAHCGGGASALPVQVSFDPTLSSSSAIYQGTFFADPQWSPVSEFDLSGDNHDVGVVVFGAAQKPKIKPMPLAPLGSVGSLPLGSQITAVGYGLTSPTDFSSFGTRRDGTMPLQELFDFYTVEFGPSFTCGGDSGGPELATISGTVYVVAVTNFGDFACGNVGVDHRVDTAEVQSMVNATYPGGPT